MFWVPWGSPMKPVVSVEARKARRLSKAATNWARKPSSAKLSVKACPAVMTVFAYSLLVGAPVTKKPGCVSMTL